jgi:hypothetical protein
MEFGQCDRVKPRGFRPKNGTVEEARVWLVLGIKSLLRMSLHGQSQPVKGGLWECSSFVFLKWHFGLNLDAGD